VSPERPLSDRLIVRIGAYAWGVLGLMVLLVVLALVFAELSIVTVPLALALFPTTILVPLVDRLERRGLKRSYGAGLVLLLTILVSAGIIAIAVNAIQREWDDLVRSTQEGYELFRESLEEGLFGLPTIELEEIIDQVQSWAIDEFSDNVLGALVATVEGVAALGFGIVAFFFLLRDGHRIAAWLRDLFPAGQREHVAEVGIRTWRAIGGYIRGQTIVAFVDAVFIGIGLVILGVPLAFVLSVLIFFGGYVPIVGAFVTGTLAVLVALASEGPFIALLALAVIVAVQQLESNLLAPMVLGRSTALHPLAVLIALTVGAILYGVIGAILAVPIAASIARAAGYWREVARPEEAPEDLRTEREVGTEDEGDAAGERDGSGAAAQVSSKAP
jgi:putative heme transporter